MFIIRYDVRQLDLCCCPLNNRSQVQYYLFSFPDDWLITKHSLSPRQYIYSRLTLLQPWHMLCSSSSSCRVMFVKLESCFHYYWRLCFYQHQITSLYIYYDCLCMMTSPVNSLTQQKLMNILTFILLQSRSKSTQKAAHDVITNIIITYIRALYTKHQL